MCNSDVDDGHEKILHQDRSWVLSTFEMTAVFRSDRRSRTSVPFHTRCYSSFNTHKYPSPSAPGARPGHHVSAWCVEKGSPWASVQVDTIVSGMSHIDKSILDQPSLCSVVQLVPCRLVLLGDGFCTCQPDIRVSRAVPCGGTHCWALLQLALLDSSPAARLSANKSSFACCVWRAASRNFQMLPTSPLLHEASLPLLRGIPLSVHALDTSHDDDPRCHTEDNLPSRLSVVPLDTTLVPRRRICQCGARFLAITHMVPSLKDQ